MLHQLNGIFFNLFCQRFLYGQMKEIKDVQLAVEVFKFAHEMQINSLMHAVIESFKAIGADDVLPFYALCTRLEHQRGLEMCKTVSILFWA